MKTLFVLLILSISVNFKSISQVVILDSITSVYVVKDLERKDFLEQENITLKLQIVQFNKSLFESKEIELKLGTIIEKKDSINFHENKNQLLLNDKIVILQKELKKTKRQKSVFLGIGGTAILLLLISSLK